MEYVMADQMMTQMKQSDVFIEIVLTIQLVSRACLNGIACSYLKIVNVI